MIKFKGKNIQNILFGNKQISKVYSGDKLIWGNFVLDVATQALIDKATTLGYTLPTNLNVIDTLIRGMKTIGIWSKLDAFYLHTQNGDVNFKNLNIINPNQHATAYGGLVWDESGSKGNGTNAYIDMNFSTNINHYTDSNASLFAVVNENSNSVSDSLSTAVFGNQINANNQLIAMDAQGGNRLNFSLAVQFYTLNRLDYSGVGLKALTSNGDNYISKSKNNVLEFNQVITRALPSSLILHRKYTSYGNLGISCAGYGGYLTATELENFRTIFNNYLTSIGQTAVA